MTVTGYTGSGVNDGLPGLGDPVEQSSFPDIGTPNQGDDRVRWHFFLSFYDPIIGIRYVESAQENTMR